MFAAAISFPERAPFSAKRVLPGRAYSTTPGKNRLRTANALDTPRTGFNTVTTTTLTSAFNTHFTDNILRVGVNYRFSGPVVAKY